MQDLIEVKIPQDVSVRIVQETLSRMGIANKKTKTLYPSCYLYYNDGKYYVCSFKELLARRENGFDNLNEKDIERRNAIVFCLYNWKLVDVDLKKIEPHNCRVFILPHNQKKEWKIQHKIKIG